MARQGQARLGRARQGHSIRVAFYLTPCHSLCYSDKNT